MNEQETKRFNDLSAKSERTAEENSELATLTAKKNSAESDGEITKAIKNGFEGISKEIKSSLVNIPSKITVVKDEKDQYDAPMKMAEQLKYLYNVNILGKSAEKAKEFLKAVDPQDITTAADGGYLVPDLTASQIIMHPSTYGQARQLFTQVPMGQNSQIFPKYLTGVTAYWVNEAAAITPSKATLGYVKMVPHKVAAIVPVTRELMEGAVPAIAPYLNNLIDVAFGVAEDTQFFAGTGSPLYGLFYSSNVFGNGTSGAGLATSGTNINTLTYQDLLDCEAGVDSALLGGARWLMHRTVWASVRGMKDDAGRYIATDPFAGQPATLLGYPVTLVEKAPTASTANGTAGTPFIVLGNPSIQKFGITNQMVVDVTKSGYIASSEIFTVDVLAIRAIRSVTNAVDLAGTANGEADAFSMIKTGAGA